MHTLSSLEVKDALHIGDGGKIIENYGGTVEIQTDITSATGAKSVYYDGLLTETKSKSLWSYHDPSSLAPTDLVVNGDCETFSSGLVTGWRKYGATLADEETGDVYAGAKSLKMSKSSTNWGSIETNYFSIVKNKTYYIQFALKILNSSDAINVEVRKSDGAYTLRNFGSLNPSQWTLYSAVVTSAQTLSGTVVVRFSSGTGTCEALIDAVSVREITGGSITLAGGATIGGSTYLADTLDVGGSITGLGGSISAGVAGSVRGQLIATRGSSTNSPGVVGYTTKGGTLYYTWLTDAGTYRRHTSLPTSDTAGTDAIAISDGLSVGSNTILGGTLDTTGAVTLRSTLSVAGNTTLTGSLTSGAITSTGTFTLTGNATISGSLGCGATTITGSLGVSTTAAIDGSLSTGGNLSVSGTTSLLGALNCTSSIYSYDGTIYAGQNSSKEGTIFVRTKSTSAFASICMASPSATNYFYFSDDSGRLKQHTVKPTDESDGSYVGSSLPSYTATDGTITAGVSSTTRGKITAYHGSGGTTPGYIKLYSASGTAYYLQVDSMGRLRIGVSEPTADSGTVVGTQTAI